MDNHYNPVVYTKLRAYAVQKDWHGMLAYLRALSHSLFRTASYVLKERILPQMAPDDYWMCFSEVALTDTKAYLITFLQAAATMYKEGRLSFLASSFVCFANKTEELPSSLDRKKTLLLLLPILKTPDEIFQMLSAFCGEKNERKVAYLVEAKESEPSYYCLFQLLRQSGDSPQQLSHILSLILRRSTPTAFNFVSICISYFGIEGMRGHFSLRINPYELSRLETDYPTFLKILGRLTSKD